MPCVTPCDLDAHKKGISNNYDLVKSGTDLAKFDTLQNKVALPYDAEFSKEPIIVYRPRDEIKTGLNLK